MIGKILQFGRRQLHTIISREIIKPLSSTPPHLQTYNLSQIDKCFRHFYVPLIFYYPNSEISSLSTPFEKAQKIKKSLSQSLTQYYPLAGTLHTPKAPYIDCNDEGVVFVEANNDSEMNMLQHISDENDIAAQLFVDGMFWYNSPPTTSLVGVQLNHFACGGIALAVSISHRVGDACTIGSFVNHWALVARYGSTDHKEVQSLNPHVIQSPVTTDFIMPESSYLNRTRANPVTRKFVFPNSKLSDLKNKVLTTVCINNPTRVEVLIALIYKTALAAAITRSCSLKPSFLIIPMNVRNKFVPKKPQTTMGNFFATMLVTTRNESDNSLSMLVSMIKKQKMELERVQNQELALQNIHFFLSQLGKKEDLGKVANMFLCCSSLCGFPYYKVDFGWGTPVVASTTYRASSETGAVLMDSPKGDGIEAWVTLESEDMEKFQNDKELLSFSQN